MFHISHTRVRMYVRTYPCAAVSVVMFIGRFAHPIRAFISLLCSALERPRLLWNIHNISLRACAMAASWFACRLGLSIGTAWLPDGMVSDDDTLSEDVYCFTCVYCLAADTWLYHVDGIGHVCEHCMTLDAHQWCALILTRWFHDLPRVAILNMASCLASG